MPCLRGRRSVTIEAINKEAFGSSSRCGGGTPSVLNDESQALDDTFTNSHEIERRIAASGGEMHVKVVRGSNCLNIDQLKKSTQQQLLGRYPCPPTPLPLEQRVSNMLGRAHVA